MVASTFDIRLAAAGQHLERTQMLRVLQLNLGRLCNMRCSHCHVGAGPDQGATQMPDAVVKQCIDAMDRLQPQYVDLTGGAPEMHRRFRELVCAARARNISVIDRCNLTILLVPTYQDLPQWLADNQVEVVASLPHWSEEASDRQRGDGSWEKSLEGLRRLRAVGYGSGDPQRQLTLMTNPDGDRLQPLCDKVTDQWRQELAKHGVTFDQLIGLTNMPIARFKDWLVEVGRLESYQQVLENAFNPCAVRGLMCRDTLSVAPNGQLYDCDFNQMLDIPLTGNTIADVMPQSLTNRSIHTGNHCFGCTAGQGSSCAGATVAVS